MCWMRCIGESFEESNDWGGSRGNEEQSEGSCSVGQAGCGRKWILLLSFQCFNSRVGFTFSLELNLKINKLKVKLMKLREMHNYITRVPYFLRRKDSF
ncbi:uncharacterized protein DS421_16g551210 [Arachis hypogaea]|nr:uncharacterized protein DS421_16g551210 [Arachis hypogaea]